MYGLLQSNSNPTQGQILESLGNTSRSRPSFYTYKHSDGNLCRCTGYRSIAAAFTSFGSDFVNVPEHTKGGCCGAVRCEFPDIEELGVRVRGRYVHADHVKVPRLPKPSKLKLVVGDEGENQWLSVSSLPDLFSALAAAPPSYMLVVGNTSTGIYPMPVPRLAINIQPVAALYGLSKSANTLVVGANQSLSSFLQYVESNLGSLPLYFARIATFMKRIASYSIRNAGSVAGNIMLANLHDFASDWFTLLCAANATIQVASSVSSVVSVNATDFAKTDMTKKIVMSITFPLNNIPSVFFLEKLAIRSRFAHALVNVGVSAVLNNTVVTSISMVIGGTPGAAVPLPQTVASLVGQDLSNSNTFVNSLKILAAEVSALIPSTLNDASYRKQAALNLFYKLVLTFQQSLSSRLKSAITPFRRAVSTGHQTYQNPGDPSEAPVSLPVPKLMEEQQTCGAVTYSGDEPLLPGTLFAAPVYSTVAVATILSIDPSTALSMDGVVAFYGAKDLVNPEFKWGMVFQDEPLFAKDEVVCAGQLIGIIVAETQLLADMGSRLVNVNYGTAGSPLLSIDDAIAANSYYTNVPSVNFPINVGDVNSAFAKSDFVIEGETNMGSQIHFQMEPQTFYSIPQEAGTLKVVGAFQYQQLIQQVTAQALQMPQSKITVETRRIGGAYGSKISRPAGLAAAVSLAAMKLGRPVKMAMRIQFQNDMIGKRNQFKSKYKIGLQASGLVNAIQVDVYQQSGAFFDGDNFSADAVTTTISNCYNVPNWAINVHLCKTNIPAQTSVRGPGWTNGVFLAEAMMEDVATFLQVDPVTVKTINFAVPGSVTPYGQKLDYFPIATMLTQIMSTSNYAQRKAEVDAYNAANMWTKRGIAFIPARFNVANSNDPFGSVVVAFSDGTIQVSVGGLEMGQGLNTKVAQAATFALNSGDISLITFLPVSTVSTSNNGATGGSVTSELCVQATLLACAQLNTLLSPFRQAQPTGTWAQLCAAAVGAGVDLRGVGRALLQPPAIGGPDTYQTFGVCITEVYLDVLTGEYNVLRADILMDLGISMNPLIDVGQIEGAFLMGVGLNTLEEVVYNDDGTLFTNDTWEYKIPGILDVPIDWRVTLLANAPNPKGILRSRAVGEPPLLMGCSVFFALRAAINAARSYFAVRGRFTFDSPATVANIVNTLVRERVLVQQNFLLQ